MQLLEKAEKSPARRRKKLTLNLQTAKSYVDIN